VTNRAPFGPFTFDHAGRELRCGDRSVHLSPKAFDLLAVLLRARPDAVSKTDLHTAIWPDTFVSDGSLAVLVAEVRRALGDHDPHTSYIRTINRFGYAFTDASRNGTAAAAAPGAADPPCSLTWNGKHTWLGRGEAVLGRDQSADVLIDAVGVSRRHASVHVAEVVTIRDLASKNGTFVDGTKITTPVVLADNTEIRLGAVSIRFRRTGGRQVTETISGLGTPRRSAP
jgi:DNA-binding winged helix-turn-helix (wHTH) protein